MKRDLLAAIWDEVNLHYRKTWFMHTYRDEPALPSQGDYWGLSPDLVRFIYEAMREAGIGDDQGHPHVVKPKVKELVRIWNERYVMEAVL